MRVGRRGLGTELLKAGVDTRKLSHRARRRIASPPMKQVERLVTAVGEAVAAWSARFIDRVMAEVVRPLIKQDASIGEIFEGLDDPEIAKRMLESVFKSVDKASSDDLRVMGVQTSTVVSNAEALQKDWIRQSTDLIRATEDVRRRVEKIISDPLTQGRSVDDIRKLLEEQAGYARSRAELTARDQTLKLYGKIQEERQTAAGFTKYVWTTSLDERVREDHAKLDGTVQSWDDPPIVDTRTGRRGHPGFDFQCRCSAVPFADDSAPEENTAPTAEPAQPQAPEQQRPDTEIQRALAQQQALERAQEAARQEAQRLAEERAAARQAQLEAERLAEERARARQAQLEAEAARRKAEAERQARIEAARAEVEAARAEARRTNETAKQRAEVERRAARKALEPHTQDVAFVGDVKPEFASIAAKTVDRIRPARTGALKSVEIHAAKSLAAQTEFGEVIEVDGIYRPSDQSLKVATDVKVVGSSKSLSDLNWSVSDAAHSQERVYEQLVTHEYGHHIHMSAGWGIDSIVDEAYAKACPKAFKRVLPTGEAPSVDVAPEGAPSRYGTTNRYEFWAESFTAYHADPNWLRVHKPVAFEMVERVLELLK